MKTMWITDKIQEKTTVQIYSNPTPVCGTSDAPSLALKIERQAQLRDKGFLLWYLVRIFMMHYFATLFIYTHIVLYIVYIIS